MSTESATVNERVWEIEMAMCARDPIGCFLLAPAVLSSIFITRQTVSPPDEAALIADVSDSHLLHTHTHTFSRLVCAQVLIRLGAERHRNVIYFLSLSFGRGLLRRGRCLPGLGRVSMPAVGSVECRQELISLCPLVQPRRWVCLFIHLRSEAQDVEVGICCISLALPSTVCFRRERDAG